MAGPAGSEALTPDGQLRRGGDRYPPENCCSPAGQMEGGAAAAPLWVPEHKGLAYRAVEGRGGEGTLQGTVRTGVREGEMLGPVLYDLVGLV